MKEFKGCKNYTLERKEKLEDIKATAFVLKHDKTGARVVLIQNSDENKSFIIGFKTPQDNSTGVPHILEHSVLCGSEKYPVKDAMTEVSKGSLNTFLNAFTYPDRTLYPVASCNDKDFNNLMSVYLDAVFYPRVYKEPNIFKQEGWHYELETPEGELTYNGVVYNEMKGVYSSPLSALSSYIIFSLFPDTQYGVESGGDPDYIPDLSYEEFVAFHKKLYHPSNSRIFLYGDMDFEEKLEFIDREYLSNFEAINPDSEVKLQKAFDKPIRVEKKYPVSDGEDTKEATFLSYNVVCSDYTDIKTTAVMEAINYALVSVPGAKLKQRLIDAGIGKDVDSDFVTDTCQKVFSIIAQNAKPEDEERFVSIIEDTIREIIEEGFDKKTIEASITSQEFSFREADFGYYPKGIAYGMYTFDDWTYSDESIFSNLAPLQMYKELREGIDEGLFEKVLKERVLENTHKSILVMNPEKGLSKKKDDELKEKLAAYKATLSEGDIQKIIEDMKALKEYQESDDTEEALATIPTLNLSDIKREVKPVYYDKLDISGVTTVYVKEETNGIAYFQLNFDIKNLPDRLLPALSILKTLLGYTNTKHYSYGEYINEVNIKTGGINYSVPTNRNIHDGDIFKPSLLISGKAFYDNIADAFNLIRESFFTSDLTDKKRIRELLEQSRIRIQSYMISSGHAVAITRSMSYLSDSGKFSEIISGLDQYRYIEELCADFDNKIDGLIKDMQEVLELITNRDCLEILIGCEEKALSLFTSEAERFISELSTVKNATADRQVRKENLGEGLYCSSQVQYVALSGNYKKAGLPFKANLNVLRNILSNDCLWVSVRLQGGAYGVMCGFGRSGESYFASYRDPNLKKTIEAYEKTVEYIKEFPDDPEEVERYIITTIGDMTAPLTPSAKVARAYAMYRDGVTNELRQKERDEVLSTTVQDIRSMADYLQAILDTAVYCTVGGEEMLRSEGDIFKTILPLYKA